MACTVVKSRCKLEQIECDGHLPQLANVFVLIHSQCSPQKQLISSITASKPSPICLNSFHTIMKTLIVLSILIALTQASRKILFKVNLNGPPHGDFLAEEQTIAMDFPGNSCKRKISNTAASEIFQTNRFSRRHFTLRIPVPDGIYSLTLLFAETYEKACVPGGRVFDIALGTPVGGVVNVVEGFDIFQQAGCFSALEKKFEGVPSKGGVVVHLIRRNQNPMLSGFVIEGFPVPRGDGSEFKALDYKPPDVVMAPGAGGPAMAGPPGMGMPMGQDAQMQMQPPVANSGIQPMGQMPQAPLQGMPMAPPPGMSGNPMSGAPGVPGVHGVQGMPPTSLAQGMPMAPPQGMMRGPMAGAPMQPMAYGPGAAAMSGMGGG